MALLTGHDFRCGVRRLELSPLACQSSENADASEYTFRIEEGKDRRVWSQTYSVADWFMGQDDVWVLARAFAEIPKLVGARLPVDLWRQSRDSEPKFTIDAAWLFVAFSLVSKQKNVRITVFAKNDTGSDEFRRFFLQCSVDEAEQFGLTLEREIIRSSPVWANERGLPQENQFSG